MSDLIMTVRLEPFPICLLDNSATTTSTLTEDAVWMIKQNGGVCWHEVGAGKTMIMCVAAYEMTFRIGTTSFIIIKRVHEI